MTQDHSYTAVAKTSPFLLTFLTTPGSAALRIDNSELPAAIQVDETKHRLVARRLGAGVQVYDCDPAKGTFTFREPQADLYDLETVTQRGFQICTRNQERGMCPSVDSTRGGRGSSFPAALRRAR